MQSGKTGRYVQKLNKFNDFEDRLHNQQVIDLMIKGNTKGNMNPRSGEFFILKSKNYEDPSVALRIPVHELLDGTKSSKDLERKYSKKSFGGQDLYSQTNSSSNTGYTKKNNFGNRLRPLDSREANAIGQNYEAKMTTNLREITGMQQSSYLVPSSVLMSDVRALLAHDDSKISNRPTSALVVIDKAKQMKSAASVKEFNHKIPDNVSEIEALESVARSKAENTNIKKNSYQIKSKRTVSGISGYKTMKLRDEDEKSVVSHSKGSVSNSKYSPFLMYPMEPIEELGDIFDTKQKKSNNIFGLEYFMFPEFEASDNIEKKLEEYRDSGSDGRVYGYTKQFDNHGNFQWVLVEVLDYDKVANKFTVKWLDKFITKKVTRSNFYFDREDPKQYFSMLENANKWRDISCTFMRYLSIIDKMDSPTTKLSDKVKDQVTYLIMGNCFDLKPPRNPVLKEQLSIKERFNCGAILRHPNKLHLQPNYNIIDDFSHKKYDLKYFNLLNEEADNEFVRANHQIEFDSSLPYNEEMQQLFIGYLDDVLFEPLYIKNMRKAKLHGTLFPLSENKEEVENYLETFNTLKSKLHVADKERIGVIATVNQFLMDIRELNFVMGQFPIGYDVPTFMMNQTFASNKFFREIQNRVTEMNETFQREVDQEVLAMKARNADRERIITVEAERLAQMENQLPTNVVTGIRRFMFMLNCKFEYIIKDSMRSSLRIYNHTFASILNRFERMLNLKHEEIDYENLKYELVLDYQNHMQYQKHSEEYPLVLLKLQITGKSIHVEQEFSSFKSKLKKWFDENVTLCRKIECFNNREIGKCRKSGFMTILETETEFIDAKKEENTVLIDQVFSIVETFLKKVKEFEFLFDDKIDFKGKISFKELKKHILAIKIAREQSEIVLFKDKLQTGMFFIDCEELRVKIRDQIKTTISTLVNLLIDRISTENDRLAQEIEEIERNLTGEVDNVEELEVARQYIENIEEILKEVMVKIRDIMGKMDLVEDLQYKIPFDKFRTAWKSFEFPARIKERARRAQSKLDRREKDLVIKIRERQEQLDNDIGQITVEFDQITHFDNLDDADTAAKQFIELNEKMRKAKDEAEYIQNAERITNQQKTSEYLALNELLKQFSPYYKFWEYASNLKYKYINKLELPLGEIVKTEFTVEINEVWNDLFKMEKTDFKVVHHMTTLCRKLRAKYGELKPYIPLVADLKNESLKNRHWADIMQILKIPGQANDIQKVTLRTFLDHGAMEARDQIKDVSEIASKENSFLKMLNAFRAEWKQYTFETQEFRNTKKFILKNVDPITDKLDEDIAKMSSILSSPYVKFLENDIMIERNNLIQYQEIIDIWIRAQKHWQYLQPIFSSEDIIKQRPTEAIKFKAIEDILESIMDTTRQSSSVAESCKQAKIFDNLTYCFDTAEDIIKSLNNYLDEKRQAFPRFYFLPNEELLTILAQTKEVRMIQKFLNKCFEGIETLTFTDENLITEMNSSINECLTLNEQIDPFEEPGIPRNVEEWLGEVEKGMKDSLKDYYQRCLEDFKPEEKEKWLFAWPSQVVVVVGQTQWTAEVEDALMNSSPSSNSLDLAIKAQRDKLMKIVSLIQKGEFSVRDTITLEVLIILEVHGLDAMEELKKNNVQSVDSFEWTSQLRYYWSYSEKEKLHKLSSKMIITERAYGWEYLGNQGRLVITPLTDRCYRTLMSALHMNLGGAPEGPAGTGKTETTKDLAKALAKHCVVFNCSDELEIVQMSKFFMGLTSCGSWACFDEFNRIELEVLSVIAQQILLIQTAILAESETRYPARKFLFNGSIVALDSTCAIFITMNPGYAGRSELPDNLKRLFRSIAMMIPNYSMIAEISLYSYGYQEARVLATKIVQSLRLSSEQLSTQSHYDFGMRSVKTILTAAGNLKRKHPQENESSLIIRAIRDCTFPKFISEDIPLFDNILSDLFPDDELMKFDYGNLEIGLQKASGHLNLVLEDNFKEKIIQLYETIRVRHGLMIVGEPFSGKSSIMKTLKMGWEFGEKINLLKKKLELEAKTKAFEHKAKKQLKLNSLNVKLMAISALQNKNASELEDEVIQKPKQFDPEDPEQLELFNQFYKESLDSIQVEDLFKFKDGLLIDIDKINPKAIAHTLLYGVVDEASGDWKEGVTAKVFKECVEDSSGHLRWIVFDGPVDAVWIENMNTVLDDNKKLCLANSEQIKLTNKMSIIFEVEDLAEASLATVSRCGMVFMEARQLNRKSIFENWYRGLPETYKSKEHYDFYSLLYTNLIEVGFELFKDENIVVIEHYSDHHKLVNILRYFQALIFKGRSKEQINQEIEDELEKQRLREEESKLYQTETTQAPKKMVEFGKAEKSELMASMIFSIMWGMGSAIDAFSRDYFGKMFGSEVKTIFLTALKGMQDTSYPPDPNREANDSLFDVFYSFETKGWQPFMNLLGNLKIAPDTKFSEIFVPTKDSVRNSYLMKLMIKQEFPFLLFGKTGTGKTQVVKKVILEELDQSKYIPVVTVLSANTKRDQLQDLLESKLEKQKRAKGIYGPLVGTKNIIFVDDLNMPNKEKYGAQPPLELIRQAIDEQGWYDRKSLEFKKIVDVQFLGGMGLGRPAIPNRLNRHFTTLHLFEYDEETVKYVYKTILDHGLANMPEKVKIWSQKVVNACVRIYKIVCKEFKPLPGKSHYLFNLRDLSKIIQGICSVSEQELADHNVYVPSKLAKLVVYESKRVFSDRFVDIKDKNDLSYSLIPVINDVFQEHFDKLVPPKQFFVFGNFMDQNTIQKQYKEITSIESYKDAVKSYIDEYNEINKKKIDILLFEECLDNLAKLNRILSREYGHALQVGLGGDGRRTLTRLATYMQGYDLMELEVQKDINVADWQENLKEVFKNCGIKNKKCTFLLTDSQLSKDSFYEDINNILNIGEVPNLFKADDKENIISDVKVAMSKAGKRNMTSLQAWESFVNSCKSNLHLVLCVNPIGDSLRLRLRNFPSLVNCSSIIWYLPWTKDSLKIIGMDALSKNEDGQELIASKESVLTEIFVDMHQAIIEETVNFQKELKKYYYVTPLNYRVLLHNFNNLLSKKQQQLISEKDRYQSGVKKLDECAEYVEEQKKKLQALAPQLKLKSEEAEVAYKVVEEESQQIEHKEKIISKDRIEASEKQRVALEIKAVCDEKLSEASPALEKAQKQVEKMDRSSLVEIKSLKEPPAKAIIILEGVFRLFGFSPKKNQEPAAFFKQVTRKELSNVDEFMNKLRFFKVEMVAESTINNVKSYMNSQPKFNESTAEDASAAFKILYGWVVALIKYYDTYQSILPLRQNLKSAEESLAEANESLSQKEAELKVVQDKVEELKRNLENIQEEQSTLSRELRDCEVKLNRSLELNEKLGGERVRWEEQVVVLTTEIENILGDIILACGYLSYLGPFTLDYRAKIVKERWVKAINDRNIPNSGDNFTLEKIIGNPIQIQEWNFKGLPLDSTSVENVLILKNNEDKYPLVVDPQNQFLKFIKALEKKPQNSPTALVSIKASMENREMEMTLCNSIRRGDVVIVEALGENISGLFDDLLAGNFTYSAGMKCIQVGTQVVEMDKNFKLYLVSNLSSPHYSPELLSKVVYLDFSITPTGLGQQMVSLVCKTEEPKDEEERIIITRDSTEFMNKQKEAELKILRLLTESKGDVVENDALINSLNESKANAEDIKARLKQSAKTEEKIERNRQNYKPLAMLITNIYLSLKELYKLDPMYQFSLKWFEKVIVRTIHSTEKPPIKNVEKRVADLTTSVLRSIYLQICRSIFVKHKQLFSFLLSIIYLRTSDKLDTKAWTLLLTETGPAVEEPDYNFNYSPSPDNMSLATDSKRLIDIPPEEETGENADAEERQPMDFRSRSPSPGRRRRDRPFVYEQPAEFNNPLWRKIEESSKLPQFSELKKHSSMNPEAFLEYIDTLDQRSCFDPDIWPQDYLVEFTEFNALTFIKLFRPDLFPEYAREFIKSTIGQYFNEEVIVPLDKTYLESDITTPFIYILSPGDDPQEEIKKFAQEKNCNLTPISLGRGQGKQAEKTINECCVNQSWVLLQNCHLAVSWLPNLERIIEDLSSDKRTKPLDPNFRLFLTAFSTKEFPISILQNGIKLTKDPPKGVKANMLQIYSNQASTKPEKKFFSEMNELRVDEWRSLFMSLSYFHAVIRERRRFGPVGWNIPYDFNESDFKISVKQLKYVLNENPSQIPMKALLYLTSECYYGGKVTDNMDRRLLSTLLLTFYTQKAINYEYFFSESKDYFIPKVPLNLEDSLEFISSLPDVNEPQIYGLNSNASISSAINDTTIMIENILAINPSESSSGANMDFNAQVKSIMNNVLKTLPSNFDVHAVREQYGISYEKCMNTVLIQEILRYNTLLSAIKNTSQDLINACEGTIVMTTPLELMADRVVKNQIPEQWTKKSYPSLKPMISYIEDLCKRIKMFNDWIDNGQPSVYWVPGFFFTQSFFTGVLQDFARKQKISIDKLEFKHYVMKPDFDPSNCESDGCYTSGLYLEAAAWDSSEEMLQESLPKKVFFDMPTIYFKPFVRQTDSETQQQTETKPKQVIRGYTKEIQEAQECFYECPLYKTTARRGTLTTTGHSTNFILSIMLRSFKPSEHWIKRGVALVTQLND